MGFIKKFRNSIILLLIILVAVVLRFYQLGDVPNGLQQDETSIGYNAYSVLHTGADEYGSRFPLSFKAFGEYKLPLSVYITVPSIAIFGMTEFAVRLPFALFGIATIFVFYAFVKELFGKPSIALVSAFLLAINPWHLFFSRGVYEVVPALFFIVLGAYLYLVFLRLKNFVFFSASLSMLILSIYTYNIARLFVPLLIVFLLVYSFQTLRKKVRAVSFSLIIPLIVLLPFFFIIFSSGGYASTEGTLIFSSTQVQSKLLEFRSYIVEESPLLSRALFNKWMLTGEYFLKNVGSYFNADFFFLHGSPHGNHGIGTAGQFYLFELITVLVGIVVLAKSAKRKFVLLGAWTTLVILVASLTREAPHATRAFFIIPPIVIFSAMGIIRLIEAIRSWRPRFRYVAGGFAVLFAIINLIYYFSSYYLVFPYTYAQNFRSADRDVSLYLLEHERDYDRIIFDTHAGFMYTSLLFYLPYDPVQFQSGSERLNDDSEGFSDVKSFGKFEFRDIDWSKDLSGPERTLIISQNNRTPIELARKKQFYYPERHIALPLDGEIIQYPSQDEAYVMVESQ